MLTHEENISVESVEGSRFGNAIGLVARMSKGPRSKNASGSTQTKASVSNVGNGKVRSATKAMACSLSGEKREWHTELFTKRWLERCRTVLNWTIYAGTENALIHTTLKLSLTRSTANEEYLEKAPTDVLEIGKSPRLIVHKDTRILEKISKLVGAEPEFVEYASVQSLGNGI